MSLRAVRSPEAPKITMTPGSGTLGRRPSSQRTFCCKACVSATALPSLLLALRSRLLDRVAAELTAQRREYLQSERVVLPGREAGEERARDDVRRHVLLYGLEHRPATLARVL